MITGRQNHIPKKMPNTSKVSYGKSRFIETGAQIKSQPGWP